MQKIDLSKIERIFGDRILVRLLDRPEKIRGIMVPVNYAKEKTKEYDLWYGVIEEFGLDSKYGSAYGLKVGDLIGFESMGKNSSQFEGEDGNVHIWVAEEFAAVKDLGRISAYRNSESWPDNDAGVKPLGSFVAIRPEKSNEKTASGIFIPDSSKTASSVGVIVATSDGEISGETLKPLILEVGDNLIYGKYSGCYARLGDYEILFSKQEDIIARMKKQTEKSNV